MPSRSNLVLGVVAALVVILAVVAAVIGTSRSPRTADLSTPAGTTEAYITAVVSQDHDAVEDLLDPALGCTSEQLSQMYRPSRASLSIVNAEATGETATVVVEITEHGQGLFDAWAHRESFTLRFDDGRWLVTGEPWPIYMCK
jgi:hypothetical protein